MISVDVLGDVRRTYFEQHLPIKKIVRTLSVSQAAVSKVARSLKTEFGYERGVQPVAKLGGWVDVLTEILENEIKLPQREERTWASSQAFMPLRFAFCEAFQFD